MIPSKSQCPRTHSPTELALSTALLVGIVLSYVPQQLAILLGKTSEGLSPWFLLLGSIATISTVANVLLLQWHVVQCCSVWSPLGCFENALGVIQLASQAVMFLVIGALYLHYFPSHLKFSSAAAAVEQVTDETAPLLSQQGHDGPVSTTTIAARLWIVSRRIALSVLAYLLLTTTVVALALALTPTQDLPSPPPTSPPTFAQPAPELVALAGIYGGIATLMSCLQFLPQIIHTYDAKDPGALSIGTMLMQTPGTLLLIYSLSLRPGTNVSTYLSYCVSAACQGTLLVLSLVYLYRQHNAIAVANDVEHTPRGGGQEYRYGELVITDESTAAQDIASPVFATLRSSPDVVATNTTSPPQLASTTIDVIDDDESLIEDPPATSHLILLDDPSSSPAALLPTAPPTITSSALVPSLINPASAHYVPHPSPPHSPLGSTVASIDTLGSVASGAFVTDPVAQQQPIPESTIESQPTPTFEDPHGKFASAIQAHYSSLMESAASAAAAPAAPSTPCFELDEKVALDAALSAALPPSDSDLAGTSDTETDVDADTEAAAIAQALPLSMDSVIEADKLASGWEDKGNGASVSVRSLLNEPMGEAEEEEEKAPRVQSAQDQGAGDKVQVDEQEVRSASPAAAEGADDQDDQEDEDADVSEVSASAKDLAPLVPDAADAEASLVSVGGGGASTTSRSRRGKGKGAGKGKNAKKKGGAKGGKVTKRPW